MARWSEPPAAALRRGSSSFRRRGSSALSVAHGDDGSGVIIAAAESARSDASVGAEQDPRDRTRMRSAWSAGCAVSTSLSGSGLPDVRIAEAPPALSFRIGLVTISAVMVTGPADSLEADHRSPFNPMDHSVSSISRRPQGKAR